MTRSAFIFFSGPFEDKTLVLPRLVAGLSTASLKQTPVALSWDSVILVEMERYRKTIPSFSASAISDGSAGISLLDLLKRTVTSLAPSLRAVRPASKDLVLPP